MNAPEQNLQYLKGSPFRAVHYVMFGLIALGIAGYWGYRNYLSAETNTEPLVDHPEPLEKPMPEEPEPKEPAMPYDSWLDVIGNGTVNETNGNREANGQYIVIQLQCKNTEYQKISLVINTDASKEINYYEPGYRYGYRSIKQSEYINNTISNRSVLFEKDENAKYTSQPLDVDRKKAVVTNADFHEVMVEDEKVLCAVAEAKDVIFLD